MEMSFMFVLHLTYLGAFASRYPTFVLVNSAMFMISLLSIPMKNFFTINPCLFLVYYEFGYVKGLKVYLINIFEHQNYFSFFPSLSFLHCKFNFFSNKTCRYIKNNLFKYNYNKDYCINSTFKSIGLIQL